MQPFAPQKLPIGDLDWAGLIPLIGRANRALARFDGVLEGLHNPNVLLSPLTMQEAVLSSGIEGTTATLSDVLRFEAGQVPEADSKQQDIGEILNYRKALGRARNALEKGSFDLPLLLEMHATLLDSVRGRDKEPGKFRTSQDWIGVPLLPEFLDNWVRYYHMDRPDPIVQLAVVHAQFEILHPFRDGNGRLGRILIPLFLFERKILSRPVFYLSGYLEKHRDQYVQGLRALSDPRKWNDWVAFFMKAVEQQALTNAAQAGKIQSLYETLKEKVLTLTHSQFAVPLLDHFFRQPMVKTSDLFRGKPEPSRPMIHNMLTRLKAAGVLKSVREGRGSRAEIVALPELINICEGRKVF